MTAISAIDLRAKLGREEPVPHLLGGSDPRRVRIVVVHEGKDGLLTLAGIEGIENVALTFSPGRRVWPSLVAAPCPCRRESHD